LKNSNYFRLGYLIKNMNFVEKICGNCRLYNYQKGVCSVAILSEGKQHFMPVFPKDKCHIEELGIEINQVRWWVEDQEGNPTSGNGKVKIEYPEGFFGENPK
jgi:hypothetical protein